ncbi:MAG: aspartate carbamoyltransferase [Patescibacteria group bacterium]
MPQKTNPFYSKDILSLEQFNSSDLLLLFQKADKIRKVIEKKGYIDLLKGKLATLLFYEPSSRTFSSFAAAVKRLGGQVIEYQNPTQTSSAVKGETISDSTKVFETYSDVIIMRHPVEGTAKIAAEAATRVPVINAGDGSGEHPTQAFLDLYTMYRTHKKISGLKILLVGDLLYGRTVHSLTKGLSYFKNVTIYLLSPENLKMPQYVKEFAEKRGTKIVELKSVKEIPTDLDVWYWTRVQKERFKSMKEYEKLKLAFVLTKKLVEEKAAKKTIFMHPLPRVGEIEVEVDSDPRALYLTEQIRNGMFVRMALLALVLKK